MQIATKSALVVAQLNFASSALAPALLALLRSPQVGPIGDDGIGIIFRDDAGAQPVAPLPLIGLRPGSAEVAALQWEVLEVDDIAVVGLSLTSSPPM
jgi:hypothetical protein